jgi:hypothetical protein
MAKKQSSGTIDNLLKQSQLLQTMVTGTPGNIRDRIDQSVRDINSRIQSLTGHNISQSKVRAMEVLKSTIGSNDDSQNSQSTKKLVDISRLIMGINDTSTFQAFQLEEEDRFLRYEDSMGVARLMPELVTGFGIYVSSIISPDQFSGYQSFGFDYLGHDPDSIITGQIESIKTTYGLEKVFKKAISRSLMIGDAFILILPLEKALRTVFAQLPNLKPVAESFDGSAITPEYIREQLAEYLGQEVKRNVLQESYDWHSINEELDEKWRMDDNTINTRLLESGAYGMEVEKGEVTEQLPPLYTKPEEFIQDFNTVCKSFITFTPSQEVYAGMQVLEDLDNDKLNGLVSKFIKNNSGHSSDSINGTAPHIFDSDTHVAGSLLKDLQPSQVIKLYSNGRTHGYLYYEEDLSPSHMGGTDLPTVYNMGAPDAQSTSRLRGILNRSRVTRDPDSMPTALKQSFLVDMFGTVLSKRVNKTKLLTNPDYGRFVYSILNDYILRNKRIRVTFFESDEVVHFAPNLNEDDGYGRPFTNMVLFYCKLTVALITNTLMWNIKRNRENNMWLVEVGLEDNENEVVMDLVRNLRSKELNMTTLSSLTNTMATAGSMQDMVIPVYDGQKPIERESMVDGSGDRAIMNNDLIEYLIKAILSAIIIPPSVAGIEDVEFARTLSMQHGRFLRQVISYQSDYVEPCSQVYQILYVNEYNPLDWKKHLIDNSDAIIKYLSTNEVISYLRGIIGSKKPEQFLKILDNMQKDDKMTSDVYVSLIVARFTQPSTLNVQMQSENLRNVLEMAESIQQLYLGQSGGDGTLGTIFKLKLVQEHLPTLPWERYQEILDESKAISRQRDEVKSSGGDDDGEAEDDGYGGGF